MKPHQLNFGGIGAYASDVSIDFDQLGALGLYLIVGPTGAGKTTIFDAMTYALFGKVAGERPISGIVSDHSHRVNPYVSLTFSHGENRYSIKRVPALEGKTAKTGDHSITKSDAKDVVIETITGQKKVTDYVTQLIGLEADQFMKVILLPQNEFQKFLLANSTDKMPLLRALFGTHLYESIAFKIENAANALYAKAKDAAQGIAHLTSQFTDIINELIADEYVSYPADDIPTNDDVLADVTKVWEQLRTNAATALAAYAAAQTALAHGTKEQERFDAALQRDELRRLLEESKEATESAKQALDSHHRALPISHNAQNVERARDAHREAEEKRDIAQQTLAHALNTLEIDGSLFGSLSALSPTHDPSLIAHEIVRAQESLKALAKTFEELDTLTTRVEIDETKKAVIESRVEEITADKALHTSQLSELQKQHESARAAEVTVVELTHKVNELDALLAKADVESAQVALVTAQNNFDAITSQLSVAEDELARARRHHTQHLAGNLAQQLVPNEPCPVCGSSEHPQPASVTADVDISVLEKKRDALLSQRSSHEVALTSAQEVFEKTNAAFIALPTLENQQLLRQQLHNATQAVSQLAELSRNIATLESRIEDLATEFNSQSLALTTLQSDIATRKQRVQELQTQSVSQLAPGDIERTSSRLSDLESMCQTLTQTTNRVQEASAALDSTTEMLSSLLTTSGFASVEDATQATVTETVQRELEEVCALATQRHEETLTLDGIVGNLAVPSNRPDVQDLEQALQQAFDINTAATRRLGFVENRLQQLTTLRDALAAQSGDAETLQTQASNAYNIAKVIKAGVGSSLSLERWVQRQLFEEVCDLASVQIAALTSNKYQLTLNSDGARAAKRTAGLDIFVVDSHTGKTRSVSSLSGGEQFLTSLALSLALAEVVQRHSGGVEISTLFIDEGFGSLDGDSLDLATDVLRSLQDSGRTVGVISHVESMQQELRVGIRVFSSPTGSSLEVFT